MLPNPLLQGFPSAQRDPVIQIASMITVQGESKPVVKNVMTLNTCAGIVGSEVMAFQDERDLLKVGYSRTEVQQQQLHTAEKSSMPCDA